VLAFSEVVALAAAAAVRRATVVVKMLQRFATSLHAARLESMVSNFKMYRNKKLCDEQLEELQLQVSTQNCHQKEARLANESDAPGFFSQKAVRTIEIRFSL
jgi:hypothetical protein